MIYKLVDEGKNDSFNCMELLFFNIAGEEGRETN